MRRCYQIVSAKKYHEVGSKNKGKVRNWNPWALQNLEATLEMRLMGEVDTAEEATVFSLHCFSGTSVSSIDITNRKIAGKEEM